MPLSDLRVCRDQFPAAPELPLQQAPRCRSPSTTFRQHKSNTGLVASNPPAGDDQATKVHFPLWAFCLSKRR